MRCQKIFLILFAFLFIATEVNAQLKKRIAVARFEDRTGSGYRSLGEGLADMLVTALVKTGKYTVLERQEMERILKEQQFGQSFMVTPQTAPKVGQILGVELLVIGSVSEFGTKESSIGGGFSVFGAGIKTKTSRAVVDIRLVNTTTGEIIASESKEGSESSTGIAFRYEDIDFSKLNTWDDTDIGKAARQAIDGCVKLIADNMEKIPWSGKIIKINSDGTILMKPGSDGNVKEGMEFVVYRMGEEIIDPDTGLPLGAEETKIGKIKVTEITLNGKAAKAKIIEGTGFKEKDIVREK